MGRLLLLICMLSSGMILGQTATVQDQNDTTLAYQYYLTADSLRITGNYDSAITLFNQSVEIYNAANEIGGAIKSLNNIPICLWSLGDIDAARNHTLQTIDLIDTALAGKHLGKAKALRNLGAINILKGNLEEATLYYRKVVEFVKEIQGPKSLLLAEKYTHLGAVYKMRGLYDSTINLEYKALEIRKELLGEKHILICRSLMGIATLYSKTAQKSGGIELFEEARRIYDQLETKDEVVLATLLGNLGASYIEKGNYIKGVELNKQALKIKERILGPESGDLYTGYLNLAYSLREVGDIDEAIELNTIAYEGFLKVFGENHVYTLQALNNLGSFYLDIGELEKGADYFNRAMQIRLQVLGEDHIDVGQSYVNMGVISKRQKKYDQALAYLSKALSIFRKSLGEENVNISHAYVNMGETYSEMGDFKMAADYFKRDIDLINRLYGPDNIYLAYDYYSLGKLDKLQGNYKPSLQYYLRALEIRQASLPVYHPHITDSYVKVAEVHFMQDSIEKSLAFLELALNANIGGETVDWSNVLDQTLNPYLLFQILDLKLKCVTHPQYYDQNEAFRVLNLGDQVIRAVTKSHLRNTDKLIFAGASSEFYNKAVQLNYELFTSTKDPNYLEKAFYFAERNKSSVLWQSLMSNTAMKFAGLPDSISSFEKDLKLKINQVQTMISKSDPLNAPKDYQAYQQQLINYKERKDSLETSLENNYPRYYSLKYDQQLGELSHLQEKLETNQAILKYVDTDSVIYAFMISQDKQDLFSFRKDSTLIQELTSMRMLLKPEYVLQSGATDVESFANSASYLFQTIMSEPLSHLDPEVNRITLIPDGALTTLPFELLLTDNNFSNRSFKDLSYLFKKYAVSYYYSANLMIKDMEERSSTSSNRLLAIAPSYTSGNDQANLDQVPVIFRDALVPLSWNSKEVEAVTNIFEGTGFVGEEATESSFKATAPHHNMLHLAMHALVDNENPLNSRLVFSDSDSIDDGLLHTYELYNLDLNIDMVVLSACNTGVGELQRGEGIMSLGRAFAYAGCPSVIMSHWSVDDKSTASIMENFYTALANDESRDVAMQQAKIKFLEEASELKQHPVYWAGFVLMGDSAPITKQSNNWAYWMIFLTVATGIVISFALRPRK